MLNFKMLVIAALTLYILGSSSVSLAGGACSVCAAEDPPEGVRMLSKVGSDDDLPATEVPRLSRVSLFITPKGGAQFDDLRHTIIGFLPPESQQAFALVCRAGLGVVLLYRMHTDPRKLHEKPWHQGPPVNSTDLFRFNAAVFHGLIYALKVWDGIQDEILDRIQQDTIVGKIKSALGIKHCSPELLPIKEAQLFLTKVFTQQYPELTPRVTNFLNQVCVFLMSPNRRGSDIFRIDPELEKLAQSPNNKGEVELMGVWNCFNFPDRLYQNRTYDGGWLKPLDRVYWAKTWRGDQNLIFDTHSGDSSVRQAISVYDDLFRRVKELVTYADYKEAILFYSYEQRVDRVAEIYDKILETSKGKSCIYDYIDAVGFHTVTENFSRVEELSQKAWERFSYNPDSILDKALLFSRFPAFHFCPHKRKELLQWDFGNWLKKEDKVTYLSLFKDLPGNSDSTLQAIDKYVSNPDNYYSDLKLMRTVVYGVGYLLHSLAGDRDSEIARQMRRKLDMAPYFP